MACLRKLLGDPVDNGDLCVDECCESLHYKPIVADNTSKPDGGFGSITIEADLVDALIASVGLLPEADFKRFLGKFRELCLKATMP